VERSHAVVAAEEVSPVLANVAVVPILFGPFGLCAEGLVLAALDWLGVIIAYILEGELRVKLIGAIIKKGRNLLSTWMGV
jgi:hypothetical protein